MSRRPRHRSTRRSWGSWTTPVVVLVLLGSLVLLAVLQVRWIDEVGAAQRQRLEASLSAGAERFAEDFDREIARAFHYFMLGPAGPGFAPRERNDDRLGERLAERFRMWQAGAPYPELVAGLRLAERGEGGPPLLHRFDPASGRLASEPEPWPPELVPARAWLAAGPGPTGSHPRGGHGTGPGFPRLVVDELPALLVPAPGGNLVVVDLDRRFLTATFPAELAARYFAGGDGLDYDLALTTRGAAPAAVYLSDPALPLSRYLPGTAAADLFGLRWFHELAVDPGVGPAPLAGEEMPGRRSMGVPRRPRGGGPLGPLSGPPGEARWRLVVGPRAGSLEAAVGAARRRNLALSLGVLALLAGSVAVLAAAARRAQRLARQQLEFVAGVTHELHTPLAAICSAGENLADGVVAEGTQVRRYGAMIRDAGRRLAAQVAQALELAGMESGRERYRFAPAAVADAVDGALADCRWEIEEAGVEVERDLAADLPAVEADAEALRRALRNLVSNAVKYGGSGGWIAVRARLADGAVTVAVEDRGPGIARRDLRHLFEPFYRGSAAAAAGRDGGAVAGSGLGLAVVRRIAEAHGGSVDVAPRPGGGTRFTLRLPRLAAETPAGSEIATAVEERRS